MPLPIKRAGNAKIYEVRNSITLRILPTFSLVFLGYLTVGLCVSALPQFLHLEMGCSAAVVGVVFGIQYLVTLGTRSITGRFNDARGPRSAMQVGLLLCGVSGLLLMPSGFLKSSYTVGILMVALMRLLLGWGESYVSTSGSIWGIERVGAQHAAQVIAWSGVGSYGSLALGAPLGQWIYAHFGFGMVGASLGLVGLVGLAISLRISGQEMKRRTPQPSLATFRKILPFGVILALGGAGFATLTSLVTLFFNAQGWKNAPLTLTLYGACFVSVRILGGGLNKHFSGPMLACVSLLLETGGLVLFACSHRAVEAFVAASLIGIGSSLVFPILGAEAISVVQKGARATALSLYTAFIDFSIGFTSACAGLLTEWRGFRAIYLGSAGCAAVAAMLCLVWIPRSNGAKQQSIPAE